jgi:hypothetical protein
MQTGARQKRWPPSKMKNLRRLSGSGLEKRSRLQGAQRQLAQAWRLLLLRS